MRDYEGGVAKGKLFLERNPEAAEVRAWYVMNMARNRTADQAVEVAEAMLAAEPDNPWSLFALAGALRWQGEREEEALELSAKAYQAMPDRLDFALLRADVLRSQDGNEAAIQFIDSLAPEMQQHPQMLVRKAVVLHYAWDELEDDAKEATPDEGYALFEEARALDSLNVEAFYMPAAYHFTAGRREEALALVQRAAALTPSPEVHQWYWRIVRADVEASREAKVAAIEADIDMMCAKFDEAPGTLQAIAAIYGELKLTEKQLQFEDRVLADYPNSVAAEWVLVNRYRAVRREIYEEEQAGGERDSVKVAKLRAMLVAFIERPHHSRDRLLGDAYRELFRLAKDEPDVDGDFLYTLVDGMVQYEGINVHIAYGDGARALADHETHLDDAERIAKEGIVEAEKKIRDQNDRGVYETEEDFEKSLGWYTGNLYDALGWVYFRGGRLDEAAKELLHSHELLAENQTNVHHLGQYHELLAEQASAAGDDSLAQRQLDDAEGFYIKGVMVHRFGENPNEEALRALYVKQHGSEDGYEAYLASAADIDRNNRRDEVLAEMIAEPDTVVPFSLKTLDSAPVAYDELKGKVVVVNFWGVWCGPCVIEMPEVQKLNDKYVDDPDVAILTIDFRDEVDDVREWMARREYTFPVLLDDGYVGKVGVRGFPTTWFIARDGRIMFEKSGSSKMLVEEFTWRVEALREMGSAIP